MSLFIPYNLRTYFKISRSFLLSDKFLFLVSGFFKKKKNHFEICILNAWK